MSLHINRVGEGLIPLVFLHGLFGQGKNWYSIAATLRDDATSLLVDTPNHGRSAWTDTFDYDEFACIIHAEIVAREGFANGFVLVGHSMGGKLAMRLALLFPESVKALIVVDISPITGHVGSQFGGLVNALSNMDLESLRSRDDADKRLCANVTDPATRGFLLQNLTRSDGGWHWRMNLGLLGAHLEDIGEWPHTDATYGGPVLWLAGAESSYVRPEHIPLMRTHFPRALLVTIKGAGHWVHADQPAALVASLRSFLALNVQR